ncbi:hypothetical protein F52700_7987 [Fusarium sp. NRRL 52700]|nr:hypothetical protein F52700_7987 [Fusarium sp. NRRL 52700]
MPLMKRTTTVREDHTHWKCMRPDPNVGNSNEGDSDKDDPYKGFCKTIMAMNENKCGECAFIRAPRFAYAMTQNGHKLGVLGSVKGNVEMWHYELKT